MEGLIVGRMVHFVNEHGLHQAAVITRIHDKESGYCNLQVFVDASPGLRWETSRLFSDEPKPLTWHWI